MISKTKKAILHALSYGNIELESSRRMADLKQLDAMRIFVKKLDARVYNGEHEVPVRLYFPFSSVILSASTAYCFSQPPQVAYLI